MQVEKLLNFDEPDHSSLVNSPPTSAACEDIVLSHSHSHSHSFRFHSGALGAVECLKHTRVISQKYHEPKHSAEQALLETVRELRAEHNTLVELNQKLHVRNVVSCSASSEHFGAMMYDSAAKAYPCLYQVSELMEKRYGLRYLTGPIALVMLEIMAYRRNVVKVRYEPDSRRCSRTELQVAPRWVFEAVIQRGVTDLRASFDGIRVDVNPEIWVHIAIEALAKLHQHWSQEECLLDRAPLTNPLPVHIRSITSKHDSQIAKPMKMIKRCLRCGELRVAGLGHKRSTCRDGHHVKSKIPYSFCGSSSVAFK